MSDDPHPHRRVGDTVESRVVALETDMRHLIRQLDRHMIRTEEVISKLDARADHLDLTIGRLVAALAVIIAFINIFAPSISKLLGLPS